MNTTVRFGASTSNIESGGDTILSKKRGWSLWMSLPAMMNRSARLRASVSVDMIQPDDCRILKLRYCASLSA